MQDDCVTNMCTEKIFPGFIVGCAAGVQAIQELGMRAVSWSDFVDAGQRAPFRAIPPAADDLCTIMYTSGTTGNPKVCKKVLLFLDRYVEGVKKPVQSLQVHHQVYVRFLRGL